jgi:glycosyltransferase involved in cell wall biosynthesis
VHHHNVLRELSVSVLGVPRGVPCVLTVHDHRLVGDSDGSLAGIRDAVDRLVKRPLDLRVARGAVDATLAVSDDLAARLRTAGMRGVAVVDNPAGDPGPEPAPPSGSRAVLFAGRLSPDKGVDVLLGAWREVVAADPLAELVIVGDGPAEAGVAAAAAGLPRVRLLGRLSVSATQDLLRSARVVCVPSLPAQRREGTPLVAAEAALHGRGLVVSDDAGLAALVGALGAGAVVPAGDATALALALADRLADDRLVDREGAALRAAAVPRFSTDAVAPRHRQIYEALRRG